jgi:hypothetical protein
LLWNLGDSSGIVRSDIEEREMFHLMHINVAEGTPVYAISDDGTQRVTMQIEILAPDVPEEPVEP